MDTPMPDLGFNMMALLFKARDLLQPRKEILQEANIKPGFLVLDYGCGPGGYVAAAAEMVGEAGQVYALDIHPLAIQRVQNIARKRRLANVGTIQTDCETGLPDNSVDVVLLYDVFHGLSDPQAILTELHRVLKRDGTLSFNDHHMHEAEILSRVTSGHLFKLARKGKRTFSFSPQDKSAPEGSV
jgi:ubiquinone/menaquinone biosynthesis C-methylase UbiE